MDREREKFIMEEDYGVKGKKTPLIISDVIITLEVFRTAVVIVLFLVKIFTTLTSTLSKGVFEAIEEFMFLVIELFLKGYISLVITYIVISIEESVVVLGGAERKQERERIVDYLEEKVENEEEIDFEDMDFDEDMYTREEVISYVIELENYRDEDVKGKVERSNLSKGERLLAEDIIASLGGSIRNIEEVFQDRDLGVPVKKVRVLNEYRGDLIEEPERIIEASDFINSLLPELESLVKEFEKVEKLKVKSELDQKELEESRRLMGLLFEEIEEEYNKFKEKDVIDLKNKIEEVMGG